MDINPFSAFVAKRVRWSLEQHDLRFPEPRETYDFDRSAVKFWGQDGKARVWCAISEEALVITSAGTKGQARSIPGQSSGH